MANEAPGITQNKIFIVRSPETIIMYENKQIYVHLCICTSSAYTEQNDKVYIRQMPVFVGKAFLYITLYKLCF